MRKAKHRPIPSPDEEAVEDSWVIVKKQKINILIPPLLLPIIPPTIIKAKQIQIKPSQNVETQQKISSKTTRISKVEQIQLKPSPKSKILDAIPVICDLEETQLDGKMSDSTTQAPISSADLIIKAVTSLELLRRSKPKGFIDEKTDKMRESKCQAFPFTQSVCGSRKSCLPSLVNCDNGGRLPDQSMRALNLERKIEMAGGLTRWLIFLGLEQFIKMFEREKIDQFQLLDLTMNKLKAMGANAVGPRRKLIHAIDCCFCYSQHFKN